MAYPTHAETDPTAAHDHAGHEHHGPAKGFIRRWVMTTNHKDIGTLYMVFACLMFFIGGAMAMVIRLELFKPGLQFVDPQFFNSMTTMHVGAPDMALPRMNNFSFWILPFAFTLMLLSFFVPGGAPAGGWTLYPPLTIQSGDALPMAIFAVHMMGISSIM